MLTKHVLAERGGVERGGDLVERQAELAEQKNLLEPHDVGIAVEAIAGRRALRWDDEASLVVVVQRPDGDAGQACEVSYRECHGYPSSEV